jgi:hypothetical protein
MSSGISARNQPIISIHNTYLGKWLSSKFLRQYIFVWLILNINQAYRLLILIELHKQLRRILNVQLDRLVEPQTYFSSLKSSRSQK